MKNVVMRVEGKKLILEVPDLEASFGPSSSGKTEIVATTSGPKRVEGYPALSFGLNVFRKIDRRPADK